MTELSGGLRSLEILKALDRLRFGAVATARAGRTVGDLQWRPAQPAPSSVTTSGPHGIRATYRLSCRTVRRSLQAHRPAASGSSIPFPARAFAMATGQRRSATLGIRRTFDRLRMDPTERSTSSRDAVRRTVCS